MIKNATAFFVIYMGKVFLSIFLYSVVLNGVNVTRTTSFGTHMILAHCHVNIVNLDFQITFLIFGKLKEAAYKYVTPFKNENNEII